MLAPWKKSYDKPRQHIKKQRHYFTDKSLSSQSYGFSSSHIRMWKLDHKVWTLKNWWFWTVVLKKTLESLLDSKEIKPVNYKGDRPWLFIEAVILRLKLQYMTTWYKEPTHWKRPWCWERLRVGGEGDNRVWDDWMASPTQWMWVWVNSGSWWWTGRPSLLQSMGSQRVGPDWATELNWIELNW